MPRKPKEENDQLAKAIGEQIRQAMERLNVSVTELHKRTGISRTVLLAYTRGTYAPGARELKLLCDNLDVTPSVLLYGPNPVATTPYRLGDLQVSEGGLELMAFVVLLSTLTAVERQSLLTLAESISAARDAQRHRDVLASLKVMFADKEFQRFWDQFPASFAASTAMTSLQEKFSNEAGSQPGT